MVSDCDLQLEETVIEGMLTADWSKGTTVDLTGEQRAVCLDGKCWRVETEREEVMGFVNPANCATSIEIRDAFEKVLMEGL